MHLYSFFVQPIFYIKGFQKKIHTINFVTACFIFLSSRNLEKKKIWLGVALSYVLLKIKSMICHTKDFIRIRFTLAVSISWSTIRSSITIICFLIFLFNIYSWSTFILLFVFFVCIG